MMYQKRANNNNTYLTEIIVSFGFSRKIIFKNDRNLRAKLLDFFFSATFSLTNLFDIFLLLTSYFLIFFVMFEHFQTVILSPLILINIKNKHVNVKEVNGEFGLY